MKVCLKKIFTVVASFSMVLSFFCQNGFPISAEETAKEDEIVSLSVNVKGTGNLDISYADDLFTVDQNREFDLKVRAGEKVRFKAYTDGTIDDIRMNEKTITEYEQNKSTLEFEKEITEDTSMEVVFNNGEEADIESEEEAIEIQNEGSDAFSGLTGIIVNKVYVPNSRNCFVYWDVNVGGKTVKTYCGYPESAGPKVGMEAEVFEVGRDLCPLDSYMAKALYYLDTDEAPIIETLCQEQMHTVAGQKTTSDAYYLYTHGQMDNGWYKKSQAKKAELDAMDPAPESFKIYGIDYYSLDELGNKPIINTSQKVHYQVLYFGVKETSGNLKMNKKTADIRIDEGNSCYSLEGTEYGVYSDMTCENSIGTLSIGNDGTSNTLTVAPGTYYVKETKAGKGYALDEKVYTVNVSSGETTTFEAEDMPLSDPVLIVLEKKDEQGKRLKNARFTVEYFNDYYDEIPSVEPTRKWILKTNDKGQAVLNKDQLVSGDEFYLTPGGDATFPLGTVVIYESAAPEGYILDAATKHVIRIGLDKAGKIAEYNAPEITDYKVTVSKKDVAGEEVIGASMRVVDTEGNVVDSWTSDGSIHLVKNLEEGGDYIIQEVVAADGYVKATDIPFRAGKEDQHFDVIDKMYGVFKADQENNPVIGAKLQVVDKAGNEIETWVSTEDVHYVSGLAENETYVLKELEAPEGYTLAEDYEFTVTKEKENQSYVMIDVKEIHAEIRIHKKDGSGNALKGVEYSIDLKNSETGEYEHFGDYTTDEKGEIIVTDLELGMYRITETKTAGGMSLLADPIEIELPYLDANGEKCYVAEYEITDSANLIMPSTGGIPTGKYFMFGCSMLLGAAVFFIMEDNKNMIKKINRE